MQPPPPPFVDRLYRRTDRVPEDEDVFPFTLACLPTLDVRLTSPMSFFVGENGSGKSTVLEALASLAQLPVGGGSKNELAGTHAPERDSALSPYLRAAFRKRPTAGYFFRAEFQAHFASLLDDRKADPDFLADPYGRYGGRSLHTRSHGEAFLSVLQSFGHGLFLLDEPEAALSPQRQLSLLSLIARRIAGGRAQFVVATHSPILLTYPGAQIIDFDQPGLPDTTLRETKHYAITRGILEHPERYWRHLLAGDAPSDE
jgi:predicted ATPase